MHWNFAVVLLSSFLSLTLSYFTLIRWKVALWSTAYIGMGRSRGGLPFAHYLLYKDCILEYAFGIMGSHSHFGIGDVWIADDLLTVACPQTNENLR